MEEVNFNIISTIELLISLNFYLHPTKCHLKASRQIDLLGFHLNSVTMTVSLTDGKRDTLLADLQKFSLKDHVKIRDLAAIIGRLVAAFPGSEFGPLFYRNLEANKQAGLTLNHGGFDGHIALQDSSKAELRWWIANLPLMQKPITYPNPAVQIYTDASNSGWGAHFQGKDVTGTWSVSESQLHINEKEMLAVLFGLTSLFPVDIHHITLRLNIDNTTVVHILKNMGSSHNLFLNDYARRIWLWAQSRHIWLLPVYVSSTDNLADRPSRQVFVDAEWQLNRGVFLNVLSHLDFAPTIDLFASSVNTQLPVYVSYQPDPNAHDIDAFSIDWGGLKFYAFPPFSCISRCLQKIKADKAHGILVVPNWPTQPFYPLLLKMSLNIMTIPRKPSNLILPTQPCLISEIAKKAAFLACLISGN